MVNVDRVTILGVCIQGRSLARDDTVIGLQMLGGYAWLCCESVANRSRDVPRISHTRDFLTIDCKGISFL